MVLGLLHDAEVVGSASDGNGAIALAEALLADVVPMDLRVPRCDGIEAIRIRHERIPGTKVVVLTTYADDQTVLHALRAGARDSLPNDVGGAEIRQAQHQLLDDPAVIAPAVQNYLVEAIASTPTTTPSPSSSAGLPAGLTARAAEVLTLIASALSNFEIAGRLAVIEGTVPSHINHFLAKIDAGDRAQAITDAYQHGLA